MPRAAGNRLCEPPELWVPFFTRGNTWRNTIELKAKGWYFQDDGDALHGPYETRTAAYRAMAALGFGASPP